MAFYDGFYATSIAGTGHRAAHFRRSRFLLADKNCQLVLYVWAVCSMPRDERIKYLTRKKPGIEIPFRKSEKEVLH